MPLAQAAEHLPFKQGVPGSIPGWHTKNHVPVRTLYAGGDVIIVMCLRRIEPIGLASKSEASIPGWHPADARGRIRLGLSEAGIFSASLFGVSSKAFNTDNRGRAGADPSRVIRVGDFFCLAVRSFIGIVKQGQKRRSAAPQ